MSVYNLDFAGTSISTDDKSLFLKLTELVLGQRAPMLKYTAKYSGDRRLTAIKVVRNATGVGLAQAKDFVEGTISLEMTSEVAHSLQAIPTLSLSAVPS